MIRPTVLALAEYASAGQSEKLNIMGIFDIIYTDVFPVRHHEFYLVSRFIASSEEVGVSHNITTRLVLKETSEEIIKVESTGTIDSGIEYGDFFAVNSIVVVRNIEFKNEGVYVFEILIDDELKGMTPLYVGPRKS